MRITETLASGTRRTFPRRTGWAVVSRLPRGLVLAACLLLVGVAAQAQTAFEYNVHPRTFRACRLLMPYQNPGGAWLVQGSDNRSLVLEGMRRYPDKPAGWDLVNPLAPPTAIASNPAYLVLPTTPAYWEVPLDPHPELAPPVATGLSTPYPAYNGPQLDKFDLIYIWAGGKDGAGNDIVLNLRRPEWRATLLRAVFNGAVLWIDQKCDNNGTVVTQFAPPGLALYDPTVGTPFSMAPGAVVDGAVRYAPANVAPSTWDKDRLLGYPFLLQNIRDIPYIGRFPTEVVTGYPLVTNQSASIDSLALNDTTWQRVLDVWDGTNNYRNVAVARCGAGAIVLSAGDVGFDVVNWWSGMGLNRPLQQQAADCKFAWNVAALAGSFQQAQGNGPAQGASVTATPPPLGINWQYPDRFDTSGLNAIGPVVGAPVVNKGMAYVLSLPRGAIPARLMCFDADPTTDLDNDGNADDGIQDYSRGRSYDMVWRVDLPAGLTPRTAGPCAATMVPPGGGLTDVVLVSVVSAAPAAGAVGQIRAYDAHTGGSPVGTPLWVRDLTPYNAGTGVVVDLSTPVVYRDTVFALASEYDDAVDADAGPLDRKGTYGRVHAFGMSYNWSAGTAGPQWVYPDPEANPAHAQDPDNAPGAGANPDHATPESGRSLPPFQDPAWVFARGSGAAGAPEIPPYPTPRPTLTLPTEALDRPGVDVLLQCSTPVSLKYDTVTGTNETELDTSVGGSDYLFLPAPYDASDPANPRYTLNRHAFGVWLPQGTTADLTRFYNADPAVHREDDANITSIGNVPSATEFTWRDPADGRVYADFLPGAAREFLLPSQNNTAAGSDPTALALGAPIRIHYQTGAAWAGDWTVSGWLPGPVAQVTKRAQPNQRRVASASVSGDNGVYATDTVEGNLGALSGARGRIVCSDAASGAIKWEFDSGYALTHKSSQRSQLAKGGAAFERSNDTVYAAVTSTLDPIADAADGDLVRAPQVLGLNTQPLLRVRLDGGGAEDSEISPTAPFSITTIGATGAAEVIPPTTQDAAGNTHTVYRVDRSSRTIVFSSEEAGWVNDTVGYLWGKAIYVDYALVNPAAPPPALRRLYVLQDILRFQYSPGIIRLQHGMVGVTGAGAAQHPLVTCALPNGVPVVPMPLTYFVGGLNETAFTPPAGVLPAGWTAALPRGIIDVRNLQLPNGEVVFPGSEIVVTYTYFDDLTGGPVTARELHQVPVNFGASSAPLVLADRTLHVGTEGYRPDGLRSVPLLPSDIGPLAFNSVRKSFLSVVMDPLTQIVRGCLAQPAIPEAQTTTYTGPDRGTPVVEGSASVDSGGLLVGSNMMTALSRSAPDASGYQGEGLGFVSRLKPERTLICDNTRLVETVAGKPSWVCVGSHVAEFHEGLNADLVNLDRDNQDRKVTPFSRPAKAIYLSNGNILVADSGNDRVIEIDRTGRQVWPLDAPTTTPSYAGGPAYPGGYDYYTSKRNSILDLERPADCFRYYVEYRAGSPINTSVNGSMLPLNRPTATYNDSTTWTGTETHTVIADAGHKRVIDVVTWVNSLGAQTHRVDILTPTAVRIGTQQAMTKLSYTKAQPIFDPSNGVVAGYLCAAANMHQFVVVERGTRLVDPPSTNLMPTGSGSTWAWLAWLYDANTADANYTPSNPLIFRNIRDMELAYEGTQVFLTVTCGQFSGRLTHTLPNATPHPLSLQGAGVFEYCMAQGGGGLWGRVTPTDATADSLPVTGDDPIWWFTRLNWLYPSFNYIVGDANNVYTGTPGRRTISNLRYADVDNTTQWLDMAWNPVSAIRLPADRRAVGAQRQARHLVTNAAQIVQNLSRDNVRSTASDAVGPAALFSTVFVINSNDNNDASPDNDTHDLDRREAIPNPQDADWSDPFNQPTFADRR